MTNKLRWKITEKQAAIDALKCTTRSEFATKFSGSWRHLSNKGLLDKYCTHMTGNTIWSDEKVLAIALSCKTRSEFKRTYRPYGYAVEQGLISQCYAHMGPPKKRGRKRDEKAECEKALRESLCSHIWLFRGRNQFGEYFKCSECDGTRAVKKS
jgi:hypothetical protein